MLSILALIAKAQAAMSNPAVLRVAASVVALGASLEALPDNTKAHVVGHVIVALGAALGIVSSGTKKPTEPPPADAASAAKALN